jgi:hypothetical protein
MTRIAYSYPHPMPALLLPAWDRCKDFHTGLPCRLKFSSLVPSWLPALGPFLGCDPGAQIDRDHLRHPLGVLAPAQLAESFAAFGDKKWWPVIKELGIKPE